MSDVIQYEKLTDFLKQASLFEIYRLSIAIDNELDDPARIKALRQKFKEGDTIEYFEHGTNNIVKAVVLEKKAKRVLVRNCIDGKRWRLPYYFLKIDSREFDFSSSKKGLNRNSVKVGDAVGFNHDGQEIIGQVEKLNQKTVSLTTKKRGRWRVAYSCLYAVIDGDSCQANLLQHRPVTIDALATDIDGECE